MDTWGPDVDVLDLRVTVGKLHLWAGDLEPALVWLRDAAQFAEPGDDNWTAVRSLPSLAAALRLTGWSEDAARAAERGVEMARRLGTPHAEAESLDELAHLLLAEDPDRKYVFTRAAPGDALEWNNAEPVVVSGDEGIIDFVRALKMEPGRDIHLAGGSSLARTFVRLGLVDEYHFFVFPVISPGPSWYSDIAELDLELLSATPYENGVVALYFRIAKA